VVAGVDYSSGSEAAADVAAWEAQRRGATLRLVHGFVPSRLTPTEPPYDDNELVVAAEVRLDEATGWLRAKYPQLRIQTKVVAGSGALALVDESATAGLIVVGGRGLGGFDGLELGSVATQVGKHARCPVVVVRGPARAEPRAAADRRVLVAVDGSAPSTAALGFAFDEAAARGVPLLAVHVWSVPDMSARSVGRVWSRNLTLAKIQLRTAAEQVLADALAGWPEKHPEVALEQRSLHGDEPARVLLAVADEVDAELVVVGSRSGNGGRGIVFGSVSQAVMAHARGSVAVVRPHQG
jgi:nucleotide-binding universal stress UspA family protein